MRIGNTVGGKGEEGGVRGVLQRKLSTQEYSSYDSKHTLVTSYLVLYVLNIAVKMQKRSTSTVEFSLAKGTVNRSFAGS